jgi:hypothetical protein
MNVFELRVQGSGFRAQGLSGHRVKARTVRNTVYPKPWYMVMALELDFL